MEREQKKMRTWEPRQSSARLQGRTRYRHTNLPTTLPAAAKGLVPTYTADGKTAGQPSLTALPLHSSPALNTRGAGCPWGWCSNEFITGCWQRAQHGNSIGTAGRGGVNNSGTPLVYTALRKDEASSHCLQPLHTLTCGVRMGSQ